MTSENPFLDDLDDEDYGLTPIPPAPAPAAQQDHHPQGGPASRPHFIPIRQPEVTPGNLELMAFLGRFPAATAEALSMLQMRQPNRFHSPGLRSVGGVTKTLVKLQGMGMTTTFRDPWTKETHWSLTTEGIEHLAVLGLDTSAMETIQGFARSRAAHYAAISMVAASFYSPLGMFQDSLEVPPVSLSALVPELAMRRAFAPVKDALQKAKKAGEPGDFGTYRTGLLADLMAQVNARRMALDDLTSAAPVLWTIGVEEREEGKAAQKPKPVHQPDLAVNLGIDPATLRSRSLCVEVERSRKSWEEYLAIVATLAEELETGLVYGKAVYFAIGPAVGNVLRKADESAGTGLFRQGRLVVLPLTHRDGTPVQPPARIHI